MYDGISPESQVRSGLAAGGKWIRTIGPPPEIVVGPSGSRRDHRAKYGCLSARPRVRCLCPPGKTQHLLPKSVFDRPGSDRWNLASTTFPDAGPMVRIRFPPRASQQRTVAQSPPMRNSRAKTARKAEQLHGRSCNLPDRATPGNTLARSDDTTAGKTVTFLDDPRVAP